MAAIPPGAWRRGTRTDAPLEPFGLALHGSVLRLEDESPREFVGSRRARVTSRAAEERPDDAVARSRALALELAVRLIPRSSVQTARPTMPVALSLNTMASARKPTRRPRGPREQQRSFEIRDRRAPIAAERKTCGGCRPRSRFPGTRATRRLQEWSPDGGDAGPHAARVSSPARAVERNAQPSRCARRASIIWDGDQTILRHPLRPLQLLLLAALDVADDAARDRADGGAGPAAAPGNRRDAGPGGGTDRRPGYGSRGSARMDRSL